MDHNTLHNVLSIAFVAIIGGYLAAGVLFAILFTAIGVQKVDGHAAHASWGFRLLIFPGSAFLWPILLRRWIFKLPPPTERNAHRKP